MIIPNKLFIFALQLKNMANVALIMGGCGTGKTTSVRTLNPKETFIINVADKSLALKGWKKNYTKVTFDAEKKESTGNLLAIYNYAQIRSWIKHVSEKRPDIKYIIIDDSQYANAFHLVDQANVKTFDKYTHIGVNMIDLVRDCRKLRDDLFVFIMTHEETSTDANGNEMYKAKTAGKLVDNWVTYDGLFTILLRSKKEGEGDKIDYHFLTQDSGSTVKAPMGMFESAKIPNDLAFVVNAIKCYETGDC